MEAIEAVKDMISHDDDTYRHLRVVAREILHYTRNIEVRQGGFAS